MKTVEVDFNELYNGFIHVLPREVDEIGVGDRCKLIDEDGSFGFGRLLIRENGEELAVIAFEEDSFVDAEEKHSFIDYEWNELEYYRIKLSQEIDENLKLKDENKRLKNRVAELEERGKHE